jgi:hypothetical protein
MKKIFLILLIAGLTSCVTEKKRAKICATCPIKQIRTDSTIYKEYWTFRDSVLNVPPDSAQIEYVVGPCLDGTIPPIKETYKRDGRKTKLAARVKDGTIHINANVGHEQLKFELREKTREIEKLKSETKVLPCQDRWGEQFFYYSGIVSYILAFLALVLAVILYTIKNNNK